jgi:predicted MFS family arabinose efflux permease
MKIKQLLLLILAAAQFTHIMDFMIMMPLGPQLMRIFEITPRQFSLLVAAYALSAGAFGFVAAFLIDRFDRKRALIGIYFGFTAGTFACALAPTYELLLISRLTTGAFGGALGALILAIVSDLFAYEKRAKAIGIVMTAFSVASVAGVPFGLYIATLYSWHAPFLLLACMGTLILLLMILLFPSLTDHLKVKQNFKTQAITIAHFFTDRNILYAFALTVLMMLGQFTVIPFIAPFMVANVGFTELQLTYIYMVGGGLTIFTSPLIGKLADKHGKHIVFTIFGLLSIVPLFLITHLPQVPLYQALMVTGLFFVLINGRFVPAITLITSVAKPENRGSFLSIRTSVQQFGSSISALIAGLVVLKDESGRLIHFDMVGYIAIGCSLIAIWLGRKLIVIDK